MVEPYDLTYMYIFWLNHKNYSVANKLITRKRRDSESRPLHYWAKRIDQMTNVFFPGAGDQSSNRWKVEWVSGDG